MPRSMSFESVSGTCRSEFRYKLNPLGRIGGHAVAQLVEALRYNGRSRVRFPMVSSEFFIDIIVPAALSSGVDSEMSTR